MITFPPYPDEQITRDITARIWNERAFDTNWRRAPEVARYYAGDQFNFSSGILAAQPIAALASAASGGRYQVSDLPPLRLASSLYTVTAFVFFFLAFRLLFGQASALLAAVLTATSTQLFLDSLYARPEGFMLACFAVALYALVRGITARMPWESAWLALTGQCCGLLIGSKAAMKESPNIYRLIDLADPFSAQAADLLVNTYGWRVVASEPSEIADLAAFFRGVSALLTQYSNHHAPFGKPFSPVWDRLGYALNQIVAVHGVPHLVLAALGAILWFTSRPLVAAAVVTPAVAFIAFFSMGPVYFERNFSLYLPLVSALCAYAIVRITRQMTGPRLIAALVGGALFVMALTPPALMFSRVALDVVPRQIERLNDLFGMEDALAASYRVPIASWPYITADHVPALAEAAMKESPNIYRLIDLADPFSAQAADLLVNTYGWRVVASEPSEIADLCRPQATPAAAFPCARLSLRGPAAYARNRSP